MRSALIIVLAVLAAILGFNVSSLKKELSIARDSAAFYEERKNDLQKELTRVNRVNGDRERFLNEIEQNIAELESKIDLETLEKYVPKKTWSEIKPVIDRLKNFQAMREKGGLSAEEI